MTCILKECKREKVGCRAYTYQLEICSPYIEFLSVKNGCFWVEVYEAGPAELTDQFIEEQGILSNQVSKIDLWIFFLRYELIDRYLPVV